MQYSGQLNHVSRTMQLHLNIHVKYVRSLEYSESMNIAEIESEYNHSEITTQIQRGRGTPKLEALFSESNM